MNSIAYADLPRQRYLYGLAFCALYVMVVLSRQAAGEPDAVPPVREIIVRAIPFIEQKGAEWIASKSCISCHHTALMVWSLNLAKQKGIRVDQNQLGKWKDWASDWHHLVNVKSASRKDAVAGQPDTLAQLLLSTAEGKSATQPQWSIEYAHDLVTAQQQDGSWKSGGQLPAQKRPIRETQEVSTNWVALALGTSDLSNEIKSNCIHKANVWLGDETTGVSTEWWATRYLLRRQFGNPAAGTDRGGESRDAPFYRVGLLKRQHADGGWGWLCDEESDALGTGIALFALAGERDPVAIAAIDRARRFLGRTQSVEGSWSVRGTKQTKKHRIEPTATYWGTCWAVIGLCATIDN